MRRRNFDELIDTISLPEYLIYSGYKPNIKKSTQVHKVFEKPGTEDAVIVTKHKSPPHNWVYKSVHDPDNDKGNIVNFVVNRLDSFVNTMPKLSQDFKKVSDILNEYLGVPATEIKKKIGSYKNDIVVSDKREPFNYHLFGAKSIENFEYLNSRNIDKATIESPLFEGKIIESKAIYWDKIKLDWVKEDHYYTSFPLFSKSNEIVGIQIHKEGSKRFGVNSNREIGLWKSNILNTTNTLAICEEAVDCISHSILHNKDLQIAYLATFGTPSLQHCNVIEKELIDKGIRNLVLLNDNDVSGQEFNLNYALHFINKDHNIRIIDKDRQRIVLEFDKNTIRDDDTLKMMVAFKSYNQKKEKELNSYTKNIENKQNLLNQASFKINKKSDTRFNILVPRDKDALSLFNRQLLANIQTSFIRLKVDFSISKDWNDDLQNTKSRKVSFLDEKNSIDVRNNISIK